MQYSWSTTAIYNVANKEVTYIYIYIMGQLFNSTVKFCVKWFCKFITKYIFIQTHARLHFSSKCFGVFYAKKFSFRRGSKVFNANFEFIEVFTIFI